MKRSNDAWLVGDVGYIDVSTPKFPHAVAMFDADDWSLVLDIPRRSRWHALQAASARTLYVCRHAGRGPGSLILLHRVLLGLAEQSEPFVDHRNHDGLDDRRANLRPATRSQNGRNKIGHGRVPYKGVIRRSGSRGSGSRPYVARIRLGGVLHQLGCFPTPEAAARAYDAVARDAHGDFAFLNFPAEAVVA